MADNLPEYIITAFPNGSNSSASTLKKLHKAVGGSGNSDAAQVFALELPQLKVGTLEKLISASDSLARIDSGVESLVRKIERTFAEVAQPGEELRLEGDTAHAYLTSGKFKWDNTKYQAAVRPIEDLVRIITQTTTKLDDELKQSLQNYQEIKHELTALQRKRGGNLLANAAEYCAKVDARLFVDTEFLTNVLVVVSEPAEDAFLAQYELLAGDAVGYGPAGNRQQTLGSPVVPKSATKLAEDSDGYALFAVTVLKPFKDQYAQALTKARFAVRERYAAGTSTSSSSGDEEAAAGQSEERYTNLELDFKEVKLQLKRWVKIHYVEAFSCWLHVKMIRAFVEGVLLYGLPVDFLTAIVFLPSRKQEKKTRQQLERFFLDVSGETDLGLAGELSGSAGGGGGAQGGKKEAFYPYVSFSFRLVGNE